MDRPSSDHQSKWHIALNRHNFPPLLNGEKFDRDMYKAWMYDAMRASDEVPRLSYLFGLERTGQLPTLHRQCSQSPLEVIPDNHLTCCLGVKCKACPALLALEKSELPPEQTDVMKAWTCTAHILNEKGKRPYGPDDSEGYVKTVGDQMFWERVYSSLAQADYGAG